MIIFPPEIKDPEAIYFPNGRPSTEGEPHKISQRDLDPPTKSPRIPIYLQLLEYLHTLPTINSTAAQPFVYLSTINHNSYTVPLNSPYLKCWLTNTHLAAGQPAPSSSHIREALKAFQSRPIAGSISSTRRNIALRTAWRPFYQEPIPLFQNDRLTGYDFLNGPDQPAIVFSLHTRSGKHVAITQHGWSLQPTPTEFLHDPIQQPLPDPTPTTTPDSDLKPFRKLLRLDAPQHEESWNNLLAWTLAAMRPAQNESFHDYPILNLIGPSDSGKTVTAKLLAQLIDPTATPIHSIPTTERKLHGLAATHHVLAFDNPGKINPEKSRYLSRLSTGITSLHSQFEGMMTRPIILTTEDEIETKHLTNRVVDVELPPVENHLSQQEIWTQFESDRPKILGALLTLLSQTFEAPPLHLPNRKTKSQKIEESIPLFVEKQGGSWSGTLTDLCNAIDPTISTIAMGRILKLLPNLTVTTRKNNGTITQTLVFSSDPHRGGVAK